MFDITNVLTTAIIAAFIRYNFDETQMSPEVLDAIPQVVANLVESIFHPKKYKDNQEWRDLENDIQKILDHLDIDIDEGFKFDLEKLLTATNLRKFIGTPKGPDLLKRELQQLCKKNPNCDISTFRFEEFIKELNQKIDNNIKSKPELAAILSFQMVRDMISSSIAVFKFETYEPYLNKHLSNYEGKNSFVSALHRSYSIERDYIQSNKIFDEFRHFINYNWKSHFLYRIQRDTPEFTLISNLLAETDSFATNDVIIQYLSNRLDQALCDKNFDHRKLSNIKESLKQICYENCMLISGYYGSGKTKLSLELARRSFYSDSCKSSEDELTPILLFVDCGKCGSIEDSIKTELKKLFNSEHSIKEYLEAIPHSISLVIVLDDIHKYFQQGYTLPDLFSIIGANSIANTKWLVMMQPGYNSNHISLDIDLLRKYAYTFQNVLQHYQHNCWFQLDHWNSDSETVKNMIEEVSDFDISKWRWKETVVTKTFLTPLFANILLYYNAYHPQNAVFLKKDLYFPDFCSMYYEILSKNAKDMREATKVFVDFFLETYSLIYNQQESSTTISQAMCDTLYNHGLLSLTHYKYDEYPTYHGIPDLVWYFKMAMTAKAQWTNSDSTLKSDIAKNRTFNNSSLFDSVMSMLIIMHVEKSIDDNDNYAAIVNFWKSLLYSNLSQPLFETGFKITWNLRVRLIKLVMEDIIILQNNYSAFLELCALGGLNSKILYNIIDISLNQLPEDVKNSINDFVYVLQRNYHNLTWRQLLKVFSRLHPIHTISIPTKLKSNIFSKLGNDMAFAIVEKACEHGELDTAIEETLESIEVDRQKGTLPRKCPYNLCDYFCQSFCNAILTKYPDSGYDKLQNKGWYSFKDNLEWNERRRNILFTFSLGYVYREHRNIEYRSRYEELVYTQAETPNRANQNFALHLILHTGRKEENYRIPSKSNLRSIAEKLLKQKCFREKCKSRNTSLGIFYRENFTKHPSRNR